MSSPITRAARSTTSPFRNFFNQHFEMVKHEVRTAGAVHARPENDALHMMLADLEAGLVEQSLHHAKALARVRDDLDQLDARLAAIERSVDRLTEVLAASLIDKS
jgi:BMFP domain-containing protein YqiC